MSSKRYDDDIEKATQPQLPDSSQIYQTRQPVIPPRQGKLEFVNGKIAVGRATGTRTSLTIPENVTDTEFVDIGSEVFALRGVLDWWIGDYINFAGRKYGNVTNGIAQSFGLEPGTLYNIASIAREFETSRRREVLSFTHHLLVAPKPRELQEHYLDVAAQAKPKPLSFRALKAYIQKQEAVPRLKPPYQPINSEYRSMRSQVDDLLKLERGDERRAALPELLEKMFARLTEEAEWLTGVKKRLVVPPADKSKETET